MMEMLYRRLDGSFTALVQGRPYHVTPDDPLFDGVSADDIAALPLEPLPPSIPAPPRSIHVAWFKAALAEMGRIDAVDAVVATLPRAKQLLWEYATTITATDADVNAIADALKINLAAVFDKAETIRTDKLS